MTPQRVPNGRDSFIFKTFPKTLFKNFSNRFMNSFMKQFHPGDSHDHRNRKHARHAYRFDFFVRSRARREPSQQHRWNFGLGSRDHDA
jgi:hypothetical protein